MQIFLAVFLFFITQQANAAIVTFSVTGHTDTCAAPCATGQVSVTMDTSVAGTPGGASNAFYANAITEVTIGSWHFSSPVSTAGITNDFYNGEAYIDLFYVKFTEGDYFGIVSLMGYAYTPSPFVASTALAINDMSALASFVALVGRVSDNTIIEQVNIDNQNFPHMTPGVPEPSTWAMMLLGFVGIWLTRSSLGVPVKRCRI